MSIKHMYYRLYQGVFRIAVNFLDWTPPKIISGPGSVKKLPQVIKEKGLSKMMIVTDKGLTGLNLLDGLYEGLKADGIDYVVYDKTQPNPSIDNIEEVRKLYLDNGCQGFIAFGGGSPMDCAKGAAARVVCPNKTVQKMRGQLKIRKKLPPFFAVPTTAGTGSETTIAAVVTGADHHKYAVSDLCLIPRCAVLDPLLTVSLPPQTTAETGMDALTHAVEAYLSRFYPTRETNRLAEEAVVTIFQTLERACAHGEDVDARQALLTASYQAGAAFTRASVGNVHAIAHTLGGLYGVGHGLANAVLLPVILRDYGTAAHRRLSRLAELVGLSGHTEAARANAFIDAILAMNARLGIPTGFTCIREADLPRMAAWAAAEANPTYPVPVIYDRGRFIRVIRQVMQ